MSIATKSRRSSHRRNIFELDMTDLKVATQRANPQCTHVTMDRIRGDYICDNCHQPSEQRWLYICTQDVESQTQDALITSNRAARDHKAYDEGEAQLTELKISNSVISQWRQGLYSPEQIEMIKEQRRHVEQAIDTTNLVLCTPGHSSHIAAKNHVLQTAAPDATNSYQSGRFTIMHATTPLPMPVSICNYKCCHRCRPYLRERLPASIESVLTDSHSQMGTEEVVNLPMIDAGLARGFPGVEKGIGPTAHGEGCQPTSESIESQDATLRYSPIGVTTTDTLDSGVTSTFGESEQELDIRLRRLVTGSEPTLFIHEGPRFDLPLRPSTTTGESPISESDSSSTHTSSEYMSPQTLGDISFSTFLSTNTNTTPASSPGKDFGLTFAPTMTYRPSKQLPGRPVYAARDNSSMESLELDDDMVLVTL